MTHSITGNLLAAQGKPLAAASRKEMGEHFRQRSMGKQVRGPVEVRHLITRDVLENPRVFSEVLTNGVFDLGVSAWLPRPRPT